MAFPLTEEQRRVVDNRGGELLVSAAAGSGKTRVLVERLLDRVDREGLDIDDFLVITYTRAAAGELRARIARELSDRLSERPEDRHLRRQSALVYKAQISTIHSFCSVLLRESGHSVGLDPDFRLCDEGEARVLMSRVLEDTLEQCYEGMDENFTALVDTMAAGRDDARLAEIVLDVFTRIQSHPDPARWLEEQKALWKLEGVTDAGQTPWGAWLLEQTRREAEDCLARLERALALCARDKILLANYGASLEESRAGTMRLLEALEVGWDAAAGALPVPFPTAGRKRGVEDLEAGERMRALREACKKSLGALCERFDGTSAQMLGDMALTRPAVLGLMDLTARFAARYREEKQRRGLMDFSDLEHYAFRLLSEPEQSAHWSRRFAEVMVDEFQDTNQVQNAIFTALSDAGRKLFLVGDVKQSIYRFRLADPGIFLEKYRSFPAWDAAEEGKPRKVLLTRNFRSRAEVLEGCNDLFRAILSREFGEMDYTQEHALVPGAAFPAAPDRALELSLLDLTAPETEEDKNLLEARWAARRARALLESGMQIGPAGEQRPLEPGDILILLRSPGALLGRYVRALEEEGLPWAAEGREDLFSTTEGNTALALLRIVDNPRQDVPLLAALRSPVFGFTADRLALLRAGAEGDFYTALSRAAQAGEEDCRDFLERLAALRFGAGDLNCRELIWQVYERTNLLGIFGAMSGGERRQNNLLSLYALAGQLEESGCRSLFQFLLRLDRMRELGMGTPPVGLGQRAGVRILSIHRSKGLEAPVVLLCGLARKLNREDMQKPVLFHPRLGVGPRGLDREGMVEYPTLARRAVAGALEREMMAEELRLLYVAMTRAREKLILSIPLADGIGELARLGEELSVPPSPMALERQQTVGRWVLLHALTRREAAPLRAEAGLPELEAEGLGPRWDIRLCQAAEFVPPSGEAGRFAALEEPTECGIDPEAEAAMLERLSWRYPHERAVTVPSKLTATGLKGRTLDLESQEGAGDRAVSDGPVRRPRFIREESGLSAAERGTALHLAMQYLPLEGSERPEAVRATLQRLVEGGYLTLQQAAAASPAHLSAFFASPLGREMAAARECRREYKFSLLLPASNYYPGVEEGEEVLLQGVIDAWFSTPEGLTVIDFKSDRVTPESQRERAETYRFQLEAYSRALSHITGRAVCRRVLWFFETDSAVIL